MLGRVTTGVSVLAASAFLVGAADIAGVGFVRKNYSHTNLSYSNGFYMMAFGESCAVVACFLFLGCRQCKRRYASIHANPNARALKLQVCGTILGVGLLLSAFIGNAFFRLFKFHEHIDHDKALVCSAYGALASFNLSLLLLLAGFNARCYRYAREYTKQGQVAKNAKWLFTFGTILLGLLLALELNLLGVAFGNFTFKDYLVLDCIFQPAVALLMSGICYVADIEISHFGAATEQYFSPLQGVVQMLMDVGVGVVTGVRLGYQCCLFQPCREWLSRHSRTPLAERLTEESCEAGEYNSGGAEEKKRNDSRLSSLDHV